jgi:plastocyanin
MRRLTLIVAVALLAAATASASLDQRDKRKPATHVVTIDATSFKPAELTIRAGDTVVWKNRDIIPHTATNSNAGDFDSGTLAPGASWKHTFTAQGAVSYLCVFHPTMKGRLTVR